MGPGAQPKTTRREGGRRAERPVGSYATRTPCARGQPLRAVCPRNVVRLFRPKGRNGMPRIYSGHPTVRLPQAEAWAERERVPSGHNCRRQLATGRPEQIQEPGTAVPGTPIFANNAKRGGPPLESPCRVLSLVLSFAPKESTTPFGAAAPPPAPESARQSPRRGMRLKGFPLAFWKPSDTKSGQKPTKNAFLALSAKWPRIAIDWEVLRRKPSSRPALSCALPVSEP